MNIVLNTNKLGYIPFIDSQVDAFIIGLKNFCIGQEYVLSLKKLPNTAKKIKSKNKKIYLSINKFALEKDIYRLKKIMNKLKLLNVDAFIVSDLGVLNIFKANNLEKKVILDLQTYVTNKYSANSLFNLGVKRICLAKEITLDDIKEISVFNNGNIEVLCQGYNPITHSKRPILSCYYKKHKIHKKDSLHYIKEESRENFYYLQEENNHLTVYNDKQYSLFIHLPELISSNVTNFRIDANFMDEKEIKEYITLYRKGIDCIFNNDLEEYNKLKEQFKKKYTFDTPFLYNQSFLLKEEK